jgi:hypothetical protein
MGTCYAKRDAALYHVQRGKTHAEAAEIVGTAEHIVEAQRPAQQTVDLLSLDAEVAAIYKVVEALEGLPPESFARVVAYTNARYGKAYAFDEAGT